jgi:sialidase-1
MPLRKIQDQVIYCEADRYATFPSLARAGNGDLLCGFRLAPCEPTGHSHLHSQSRAVFVRSSDDGRSWSAQPQAMCPADELGQQDPQLATLSANHAFAGRILASFFRWQAHAPSERDAIAELRPRESKQCLWSNAGLGCCHSDDAGKTWSALRRLAFPFDVRGGASRAPAVELPSGRLLLPCYGSRPNARHCAGYLMSSDDGGGNWSFLSVIADGNDAPQPFECHEPFVLRLSAGRLICLIRSYSDGGLMRWCTSDDDGLTWSDTVESSVWGFPQAAIALRDGRVVLACGHRREPLGVAVRLLSADCSDIDDAAALVVRDDGASRDLGYPTLVQRQDGTVLLAYYIHHGDGVRHIAGSLLAVED